MFHFRVRNGTGWGHWAMTTRLRFAHVCFAAFAHRLPGDLFSPTFWLPSSQRLRTAQADIREVVFFLVSPSPFPLIVRVENKSMGKKKVWEMYVSFKDDRVAAYK